MKKHSKASSISNHLGYWLRFVSNHVSHAFALKLEKEDITVAEWVIMRELFDKELMAPSHLAAHLGMTRGAISKLADRLIAKSLLSRKFDEVDRRSQALLLTAKGHKLVPTLASLADKNDAEFFGHLTPERRSILKNIMQELVEYHQLRIIPIE